MENRFEGKTFVVTGGGAGIGFATSARFVEEGATVFVIDIDKKVGQRITDAFGSQGIFVQANLANPKSIRKMGAEISRHTDILHGLVNNCGIYVECSVADTSDEDWEEQVAINLRAPALCSQALLPLLKKGPGHIVNLSSEGAYRPYKNRWVYDATKSGVVALARNMAVEFSEFGMRANSIAPGWVVTEMHFAKHADPAARKQELETMAYDGAVLNRLARPEEIAAVIAFLMSDDASYITATTIHADGGRVSH